MSKIEIMVRKTRNTVKSNLNEIRNLSKRMPKTIQEALNFEEDEEYDDEAELLPPTEPVKALPKEKSDESAKMDVERFIDDIRKQSLQGMAQLADDPMSEQYIILKKVWQIVDKAAEAKQGSGQAQPQMPQMR